MKNFCIREDYQIGDVSKVREINAANRNDRYQINVYKLAKKVAESEPIKKVADIGCGSGLKLKMYFDNYNIVGYEIESNVLWLRTKYPDNLWIISDFNSTPDKADLVICADVIEHVDNPDELLNFIVKMNPEHIVISTPDRDQLRDKRGRPYTGPPNNKHHVREWSFDEFTSYISFYFDIKIHDKIEKECAQVIYCKPKIK
jgi:2-polyprenyl-3-methyl-5-hydroxy-6-metoxy-1,4-benzoquinol methylase